MRVWVLVDRKSGECPDVVEGLFSRRVNAFLTREDARGAANRMTADMKVARGDFAVYGPEVRR